jgi:hypothetical protein
MLMNHTDTPEAASLHGVLAVLLLALITSVAVVWVCDESVRVVERVEHG